MAKTLPPNRSIYVWILAAMAVGGWVFGIYALVAGTGIVCPATYVFIDPQAACNPSRLALDKTNYTKTEADIARYIDAEVRSGRLIEGAVYFRDLEDGPTFGVNSTEDFSPASLLKLPLAFAYLAVAEQRPEFLSQQLYYAGSSTAEVQDFKPLVTAQEGRPYSLTELLQLMLTYSDNASYKMLHDYATSNQQFNMLYQQALQELGVIEPGSQEEDAASVRTYASLFRLLYRVSYLDVESSEQILSWLANSSFPDGLVAGVPQGTTVAHKFGERLLPDGTKQLHDCGIIYYPQNPYVLCVMTKGNQWDDLKRVIQTISKEVYAEVDSRKIR